LSRSIPEEIINRVRDSVSVVDLVSRYLSLKKTGANFKALCPFHKEKTPSFTVSPSRQTFHCFGCGKGGNVFHFVMAMDRVSFPEAVRSLAKETGIEVPDSRRPLDGPDRDQRSKLYEANRRAAEFYARQLAGPAGRAARDYVRDRGISDDLAERCMLGYAPDAWDALLGAAAPAGVGQPLLVRAGLAIARNNSPGAYDRFRNRLMFPIFDTQDRVVGFGARAMGDDDVKYLNTPETPIFSKGKHLYGLNWARRSIVDTKRAAVVEGYTDVLMAHQHACEAVVATLGTALTREHIRLLRRFAERVDVVFDADPAGRQAAERSMELFVNEGAGELVAAGLDVRIVTLEAGQDPCDLIAEQGPEAFGRALDAAVDVFSHKIRAVERREDVQTIEGKTRAADEVLGLAALIPNAVGRELRVAAVIRMLADAFDIDDAALRARFGQIERRRRTGATPREEPPRAAPAYDPTERGILEELLTVPDAAPDVFDRLHADDFANERLAALYEAMRGLYESDGTINAERLLDRLDDPDAAALVSAALSAPPRPEGKTPGPDCVRALLRRRIRKQVRRILKKLEDAKTSGDERAADALNTERLRLQREVLAL